MGDSIPKRGTWAWISTSKLFPSVLDWTLAAWNHLASPAGKESILKGWFTCVKAHCDVWDAERRQEAVQAAAKGELRRTISYRMRTSPKSTERTFGNQTTMIPTKKMMNWTSRSQFLLESAKASEQSAIDSEKSALT
jgi:hypothetical protein